MKTPEQLADQYADLPHPTQCCAECKRNGFLVGYKEATPQWISVKERLPELYEYVLVTHRTSLDYDRLRVMEAIRLNDYEYEVCGNAGILADYVDYWMPLPEPPKEAK